MIDALGFLMFLLTIISYGVCLELFFFLPLIIIWSLINYFQKIGLFGVKKE